jgi:rhamnogalacturonyl hydrolase YesR
MRVKKIVFLLFAGTFFISQSPLAQSEDLFSKHEINSRMLKVADWQMRHFNNKPLNTWTNAAFYAGVFSAYEVSKNPILLDSLRVICVRNNWAPGKRFDHADDIAITQTYVDLYRIEKQLEMIRSSVDSIKKMMRTPGEQQARKGITWWWCDALFMAPPAMAKLSRTLNDPEFLIVSDTLYRQCFRLLYNQDEKLFARDASYLWDADGNGKKEANGNKIFWGRGNGWVIAGLARLLSEMPTNYPGRGFYVGLFQEMSTRLLKLQQHDGLWRTSLLDPGAYPGGEGSASGFIGYALAWGINNKYLDKKIFLPAVKKCWIGMNALLDDNGRYGWVQPIGADPRKNFNAESWESYGSGAYLLAASEILKGKIK